MKCEVRDGFRKALNIFMISTPTDADVGMIYRKRKYKVKMVDVFAQEYQESTHINDLFYRRSTYYWHLMG